MSEPITTATGAAASGAFGLALGYIFGPHIGVAELLAATVGAGFFFMRGFVPSKHESNPVGYVAAFVATVFFALWGVELAYLLITSNTDFKLPEKTLPALAAMTAYFMQALLSRVTTLVLAFNPIGRFFGGQSQSQPPQSKSEGQQ